jgi:hypothetical protein
MKASNARDTPLGFWPVSNTGGKGTPDPTMAQGRAHGI